ncbi:MAG: DUF5518 domain-containing protein [Candidatus Bathyarchaeia archaeon]|jgi:hypothetical protein
MPIPVKSRDLWTAVLAGVVVTGVLTAFLEAASLTPPLSDAVGAFVGGAIAGYVLYGKVGQATAAGALSGIIGTPFYLGVSEILFIFGVIPTPAGPTPPMSELQAAVVIILGIDLVTGAIGATVAGAIHHPPPEAIAPPPQITPGTVSQARYCVQCGAQLPTGALVCPQCNARQP